MHPRHGLLYPILFIQVVVELLLFIPTRVGFVFRWIVRQRQVLPGGRKMPAKTDKTLPSGRKMPVKTDKKIPVSPKGHHPLPTIHPCMKGEVLVDIKRKEWKLGDHLGSGGFGVIFEATENSPNHLDCNDDSSHRYVVKMEPKDNGPLFNEINVYQRIARDREFKSWCKKHKLSHLGLPRYEGSGLQVIGAVSYRFLVMPRLGTSIWERFCASPQKKLSVETVFSITLQILDTLEYIHHYSYVHADIKSANILESEQDQDKVFLVDFGLSSIYKTERIGGEHKVYKKEPKKGHNGTPEFTSIDAHQGVAPSRRGDIQIMGYVMLQWLCTKLPWEDKLTDLVYVMNEKIKYSTDVKGLIKECFAGIPANPYPNELKEFLDYAFHMQYESEPDYKYLRGLCSAVLEREASKKKYQRSDSSSSATSSTKVLSSRRKSKKDLEVAQLNDHSPQVQSSAGQKVGPSTDPVVSPTTCPRTKSVSAKCGSNDVARAIPSSVVRKLLSPPLTGCEAAGGSENKSGKSNVANRRGRPPIKETSKDEAKTTTAATSTPPKRRSASPTKKTRTVQTPKSKSSTQNGQETVVGETKADKQGDVSNVRERATLRTTTPKKSTPPKRAASPVKRTKTDVKSTSKGKSSPSVPTGAAAATGHQRKTPTPKRPSVK